MRAILICVPLLLVALRPIAPAARPAAESADGQRDRRAPLEQSLDKARSVEDLSGERKGGLDEAIDGAD